MGKRSLTIGEQEVESISNPQEDKRFNVSLMLHRYFSDC